jgi:hypothetical protein
MFVLHPRCSRLQLTHLCFVDDFLIIFSAGTLRTAESIKSVLNEFVCCHDVLHKMILL